MRKFSKPDERLLHSGFINDPQIQMSENPNSI